MKYTKKDLENIIALREQDEDDIEIAKSLANRCRRALMLHDVSIRLNRVDTKYLRSKFDPDMDQEAMLTLCKIMGM